MQGDAPRKLRCAMVGGGRGAFIGDVHRKAMALDGQLELVAGALSSLPDKARASGRDLGLRDDRNHESWQSLLAHELAMPADERIDFVCIVTPNHLHYDVAKAFVEAGFHVVCDKPMVTSSDHAGELVSAVARHGVVFGVTYNYSGYPMVRQARDMVRAGTIGDIGSHAEHLLSTVTGLEIESLCADLHSFVPGRRLDDDGSLLLRFRGGARGVLLASQIEAGCENDLRLRVFGTAGMLDWRQEDPNHLIHAPIDAPRQVLTRGSPWLSESAQRACRLPTGHPEAFYEAFANIYLGVAADIRARLAGESADPIAADYPRVQDGARGVRFIEKAVESTGSDRKWTSMD